MSKIGFNGDTVGVNRGDMDTVCTNLKRHAGDIDLLVRELHELTSQLPEIWEGNDLEDFVSEFSIFESQLSKMPEVIVGIAEWGEKKKNDYENSAQRVIQSTKNIFGV